MIVHNAYLTDEELKRLIQEAEADMVPAPSELTERIKTLIHDDAFDAGLQGNKQINLKEERKSRAFKKNPQREFVAYCFRVATAVAAAVAFIFIIPNLPDFTADGECFYEEIILWESEPLEEIQFAELERLRDCPTREEVLNDTNFIQKVFESSSIFTGNSKLNIFKEKNGGQ